LPGFAPDSKIKMLTQVKDDAEIVIVISADDIEKNKLRGDLGITYDEDVIRLINEFSSIGLYVSAVVISHYNQQPPVLFFEKKIQRLGIKVYHHYKIDGYPRNISHVVSEDGYGKNDYIETTRPLVIVTAPGPGSGKMATCLSQLYHDNKRGIKAGYAKFETFPIWNLPLRHPVNIAYEAATADLDDVNMIDPFHLEAYGETTVNYNRDVEIFPVLTSILERILGESPYKSPTDMGVNMVGNCIIDEEIVCEAAKQEIVRRYYNYLCDHRLGRVDEATIYKIELLMKQASIDTDIRRVAKAALLTAEVKGTPVVAIELPNGKIVTGKRGYLLGATSAAILNALKELGGISDDIHLISPITIEPIQNLKANCLDRMCIRLNANETLIALAISAATNPMAQHALNQLEKLEGCEVHSTVILSDVNQSVCKKLKMNLTSEPRFNYHDISSENK